MTKRIVGLTIDKTVNEMLKKINTIGPFKKHAGNRNYNYHKKTIY